MFDGFLEGRDSGSFAPGTIVCIVRPQPVNSWLGSNNLPLLDIPGSFLKVADDFFVTRPLQSVPSLRSSQRMHAFNISKCSLKLLNLHVIDTKCGGALCDSLGVYSQDGNSAQQCPCFHAVKRSGNILLLLNIQVIPHADGEDPFHVKYFTSKNFTEMFFSRGIPSGISASMISDNLSFERSIIKNVIRTFAIVNENGGWSAAGWTRQGTVADEGVGSQAKDGVGKPEQVLSSDMLYHLTYVVMNCPDLNIIQTDLSKTLTGDKTVVQPAAPPAGTSA